MRGRFQRKPPWSNVGCRFRMRRGHRHSARRRLPHRCEVQWCSSPLSYSCWQWRRRPNVLELHPRRRYLGRRCHKCLRDWAYSSRHRRGHRCGPGRWHSSCCNMRCGCHLRQHGVCWRPSRCRQLPGDSCGRTLHRHTRRVLHPGRHCRRYWHRQRPKYPGRHHQRRRCVSSCWHPHRYRMGRGRRIRTMRVRRRHSHWRRTGSWHRVRQQLRMPSAVAAGDVAKPRVGEYGDGGETGQPSVCGGVGYGGVPQRVPFSDGIGEGDGDGDGPQTVGSPLVGGPKEVGVPGIGAPQPLAPANPPPVLPVVILRLPKVFLKMVEQSVKDVYPERHHARRKHRLHVRRVERGGEGFVD